MPSHYLLQFLLETFFLILQIYCAEKLYKYNFKPLAPITDGIKIREDRRCSGSNSSQSRKELSKTRNVQNDDLLALLCSSRFGHAFLESCYERQPASPGQKSQPNPIRWICFCRSDIPSAPETTSFRRDDKQNCAKISPKPDARKLQTQFAGLVYKLWLFRSFSSLFLHESFENAALKK